MADFWTVADKFGLPIAMMMLAVVALYFDMVVSGKRYRKVEGQRDRLLKLALGGQRKAWQAADLADALVDPKGGGDDADL